MHRAVEEKDGAYALRERSEAYNGNFAGESEPLGLETTVLWNENAAAAETSRVRPGAQAAIAGLCQAE
jgi:hypothetical protein